MKIIVAILFSILFVFAVSAMGWWLHIMYLLIEKISDKEQIFILWLCIIGVIGITCGITAFMLY